MIRIATIGTSTITRRFAAAVPVAGGGEIVAVTSRHQDSGQALATDLGVERVIVGLDQVWADDTIDAVYIANPNALHAPTVEAALAAGKHVLVEKPAALDSGEFASLAAAARDRGLVLLENMRSAYDPLVDEIASRIDDLGPLRGVGLGYVQRSARYDQVLAGQQVNIFDPALGGGALNDLGVYPVHLLVQLLGEPARVQAEWTLLPGWAGGVGADGAGAALLTYDGFVAELTWSKITTSTRPGELAGERGTLVIDHVADLPGARIHWHDGRVEELPGADAGDNMVHSVRHFLRLIESGVTADAENARTVASLRTLDRIRAAATSAA